MSGMNLSKKLSCLLLALVILGAALPAPARAAAGSDIKVYGGGGGGGGGVGLSGSGGSSGITGDNPYNGGSGGGGLGGGGGGGGAGDGSGIVGTGLGTDGSNDGAGGEGGKGCINGISDNTLDGEDGTSFTEGGGGGGGASYEALLLDTQADNIWVIGGGGGGNGNGGDGGDGGDAKLTLTATRVDCAGEVLIQSGSDSDVSHGGDAGLEADGLSAQSILLRANDGYISVRIGTLWVDRDTALKVSCDYDDAVKITNVRVAAGATLTIENELGLQHRGALSIGALTVAYGGEVVMGENHADIGSTVLLSKPEPPAPATWTLPKTFRATKGISYLPVQVTSGSPSLTYKPSNKKVSIDRDGVLTAKTTGKVTLTVKDSAGASMKCTVTVVGNSFTRTKPLMLKGGGLFSSTKRLYYKNKKLYAEVFLYNRTGKSVRGAGAVTFELRDGDAVLFRKDIPEWNFKTTLKNKRYKVYKLTITDAMLPGVRDKSYDMGHNELHALLIGPGIEPLTARVPGVTKPKGMEAILSVEPVDPSDLGEFILP